MSYFLLNDGVSRILLNDGSSKLLEQEQESVDYFNNSYFNPEYFLDDYFGIKSAAGSATASGSIIVTNTSIIAGKAKGTKLNIAGRISPPPPEVIIKYGRAFGQILTINARLISGHANGTIVTIEFAEIGKATGSAFVKSQEVIIRRPSLIEGKAIGERYVSEDEMMIFFAEAA